MNGNVLLLNQIRDDDGVVNPWWFWQRNNILLGVSFSDIPARKEYQYHCISVLHQQESLKLLLVDAYSWRFAAGRMNNHVVLCVTIWVGIIKYYAIVIVSMYTGLESLFSVSVEVVHPRIPLWTPLLTRGELSHISLVFQWTSVLLSATSSWSVGEVAVEDWWGVNLENTNFNIFGWWIEKMIVWLHVSHNKFNFGISDSVAKYNCNVVANYL